MIEGWMVSIQTELKRIADALENFPIIIASEEEDIKPAETEGVTTEERAEMKMINNPGPDGESGKAEKSYDDCTLDEIKQICADKGMTFKAGTRKTTMIKALKEGAAPAEAPPKAKTLTDVENALKAVYKACGDITAAALIVASFNAQTASGLKEEDYEAVIAACDEKLAEVENAA